MSTKRNKKEVEESRFMGAENTRAMGNNYTKKGVKSLRQKKKTSKSNEEGRILRSVKFLQRLFRKKQKNAIMRKKLLLKETKKKEALSKKRNSELEKSKGAIRRTKKEVAEDRLMGAENTRAMGNNYTKMGFKSLRKPKKEASESKESKETKKKEALSKKRNSELEKSKGAIRRTKKEVAEGHLMGAENTRAMGNNYTKMGFKSLRKPKK